MPKGYWIVRITIRDAARYSAYIAAADVAYAKFGARTLVAGERHEAAEGGARDRNVVIEFDSYETAIACYHSPEYQAAKAIRNAIADADFVIVEGVGR